VSIARDDEHYRILVQLALRLPLSVRDEGIGIAPENVERIFERFERTSSALSHSGLGLGLYIARQIVDAQGGSIRAESQPGRGSTFIVTLPLNR
jgi:signal transduction histidine kinase